jgi:hypothetical protein
MIDVLPQRPKVLEPVIQVLDPTVYGNWDDLIATHPDAGFFHSRAWAKTLAEAYGFNCRYIVASGERLCGLLPIMEARSWIRGTRGVCLPFTDECSALTTTQVRADALLDVAMREAADRGWKHLDACGERNCFPSEASTPAFYGHTLSLEQSASELFNRIENPVRRAVRKAEKSGVHVSFSTDLDALRDYYRLHCRTRTRHGSPPQPFSFFESIQRNILGQGHGFVALAYCENRPISGAVFFTFRGRALYKFSASDERFQSLRGPNLVIWRTIEKLIGSGATELNFGRTSLSNAGLRRFKLGWGTEETTIYRARYCFKRRSFVTIRDLADGAHARFCAAMPIFVSRWIGNIAYPHMT